MFDQTQYVPILKLKAGELRALNNLTTEQRRGVTPFFEIPPIAWDYEEGVPSKTVDEHIAKIADNIEKHWDDSPFFLDYKYIEDEIVEQDSEAIYTLSSALSHKGLKHIPVFGLDREDSIGEELIDSDSHEHGVCFRLEGEDFDSDDYSEKLMDIVEGMKLRPEHVDIMIDLGAIPDRGIAPFISGLKSIIRYLPKVNEWRTLTVSSSSFPASLSAFTANTADTTPRADWDLWKRLVAGPIRRKPAYSDYGIASPVPFEMDPRMMRLGAKIKYTLDESWLIVKGVGIKKKGYKQFHDLSAYLVGHEDFYGPEFSWGDSTIYDCAMRECKSGNQTTWVTVGMNHHFAVVVSQLSDLDEA